MTITDDQVRQATAVLDGIRRHERPLPPPALGPDGNFAPGWGLVDGRGNWLGYFTLVTPGGRATWTYSDPGHMTGRMGQSYEIDPGAVPYLLDGPTQATED